MRNLKSTMFGMAMLLLGGAATAKSTDNGKLTQTYAVNTYVDAMTRGKLSGLNDVLDKSAAFSIVRGNQVLSFDKKEMITYLHTNRNTEQVCSTRASMVGNNPNLAIVKIDMKYANFTRSNYITMVNTDSGWKITNVYSTFS